MDLFRFALCLLISSSTSTAADTTSVGLGSFILKGLGSYPGVRNSTATLNSSRPTLSGGSTEALITSAPTGATTLSNGLGRVGNATFKTSCDFSDIGCYDTCTSYANDCMTSWGLWEELQQSCTRPLSTYAFSSEIDTFVYTDVVGKETVIAWTVTETNSDITTVWETSTPAKGCADPTGVLTSTTITSPYTVVETTDACSYETFNFTTTISYDTPIETEIVSATYLVDHHPMFSTRYETTTYPYVTTACQYSVPPPDCTFYDGYHANACTRGPDCNQCTIYGGSVQLLYWPVATAVDNKTLPFKKREAEAPSVTVFEGQTLTSPSVYISFQTAYAKNECNSTIGKAHTGSIIGLDLTELSSALGNWHARSTDLSALAAGTTEVAMYAEPFALEDLNWPYPPWIWQQQERCNSFIAQVCPVIVSGQYNPVLAVPPQIRTLDPNWSSCALDLKGLYDPPKALSRASAEALPTAPGGGAQPVTKPAPSPTADSPTPAPTSDGEPTVPANIASQSSPNNDPSQSPQPEVVPSQKQTPTGHGPALSEDAPSSTGQLQNAAPSAAPSPTDQDPVESPESSPAGFGNLLSNVGTAASEDQQSPQSTPQSTGLASQANFPPSQVNDPTPQDGTQLAHSNTATSDDNALAAQSNDVASQNDSPALSSDNNESPQTAALSGSSPAGMVTSHVSVDQASNIIVEGSMTLVPGGSDVTAGGTTYEAQRSESAAIISGQTIAAPGSASPAASLTLGDSVAILDCSGVCTTEGQTFAPGSSPIVGAATTYQMAPSDNQIMVNSQTAQNPAASATPVTMGDQITTPAGSGTYVLPAGQTLVSGGSLVIASGQTYTLASSGSAIVVAGMTYSMASSGTVVINGVTYALPTRSTPVDTADHPSGTISSKSALTSSSTASSSSSSSRDNEESSSTPSSTSNGTDRAMQLPYTSLLMVTLVVSVLLSSV